MISLLLARSCAPLAAFLLLTAPLPICAARALQQQSPSLSPQAQAQSPPRPQSTPTMYVPPFWGGSSGPVSTGLIAYVIGAHGKSPKPASHE